MGGKSSKRSISRQSSHLGSSSYSWGHHDQSQIPYAQPAPGYLPQQHYNHPPPTYGGQNPGSKRKYSKIEDNYNSLDQVRRNVLCFVLLFDKLMGIISEIEKYGQSV